MPERQLAPPPSDGTVVIILGTAGGPRPRPHRAQTAHVLLVNGTPYLIDAGENVVRRLVQAGVDFRRVGHIFITHGHSDHTLGLPALLTTQWEFQRREPVRIFGPPGTEELARGTLAFLSVNTAIRFSEGTPAPIADLVAARDVTTGVVYEDENVTVTAAENTHFNFPPSSPAYGKYKSYSYRFDTPTRTIVFSGDTGPCAAVTGLARDADVLVSEVISLDDLIALYERNGVWQAKTPDEQQAWLRHQQEEHLSPEAVGALAAEAGVKCVVLTHLTPTADLDDRYARLADAVRKVYPGEVHAAKDLDRY